MAWAPPEDKQFATKNFALRRCLKWLACDIGSFSGFTVVNAVVRSISVDEQFPAELPEIERARWQTMTVYQRSLAANRIKAFVGWQAGELSLADALVLAKLSKSRFYRLAAKWHDTPNLDAVGAFTGTAGGKSSRLDPLVVNALQAVVPEVVRLNQGSSVRRLVNLMKERVKIPEDDLPSELRLRKFVEDELRRVSATGMAGHAIRFDCTAIDIPQADRRPFIMFAAIDTGTRLVLGVAVLESATAIKGYAMAAADALDRIPSDFGGLSWTDRVARIEITAGADIDPSMELVESLSQRVGALVQLARAPKRFGRYLRRSVGDGIGRILFTPARTLTGDAAPNTKDMTPWMFENAQGAVREAVSAYNKAILATLTDAVSKPVPGELILALKHVASQ
ncbi:MAG: hypothetical protein MK060_17960 [Blastomonas sp.]|uniref:hypothetical protein n=1 Tax=Blastomonas sp. TaxID=1909299 RepID=UPI00406A2145|nr:hypothetical protein [Blastomonas sp.]